MFLRANKRFKDGKTHRYWSVMENRRVAGGRSGQKTLLDLGEINDSEYAAWTRAIEAVDEPDHTHQIPGSNIPPSSCALIACNSHARAYGAAAGSP